MSMVSLASTSSSQSQIGWVGHATKLVSSVLGGSKNKKPQVPSLQRAAAAAKKVFAPINRIQMSANEDN